MCVCRVVTGSGVPVWCRHVVCLGSVRPLLCIRFAARQDGPHRQVSTSCMMVCLYRHTACNRVGVSCCCPCAACGMVRICKPLHAVVATAPSTTTYLHVNHCTTIDNTCAGLHLRAATAPPSTTRVRACIYVLPLRHHLQRVCGPAFTYLRAATAPPSTTRVRACIHVLPLY
jgi:hypothetical protein